MNEKKWGENEYNLLSKIKKEKEKNSHVPSMIGQPYHFNHFAIVIFIAKILHVTITRINQTSHFQRKFLILSSTTIIINIIVIIAYIVSAVKTSSKSSSTKDIISITTVVTTMSLAYNNIELKSQHYHLSCYHRRRSLNKCHDVH